METFSAPHRPPIPDTGDERTQLEAWLDFYRATVLYKCDGLKAAQLKERPVESSTLSLLGIVRHMTFVEQVWFEARFIGADVQEYYKTSQDRDATLTTSTAPPSGGVRPVPLRHREVARTGRGTLVRRTDEARAQWSPLRSSLDLHSPD